ncbi:hypothetical protein EVAR_54546_1 [Eumeta japonica]|uniref:Uncharacterized protein n=1 Tax=Eumeta variegata TaxID=151549 RepID=A0A4C1YWL4_EUMVA|nr:hypothetical protein EVAR_54546_1 [Eumeta japonica]
MSRGPVKPNSGWMRPANWLLPTYGLDNGLVVQQNPYLLQARRKELRAKNSYEEPKTRCGTKERAPEEKQKNKGEYVKSRP